MKNKKADPVDQDPPTEEEEYEVEDIIDIRMFKNKPKYLVKWKGFPDSENTWEPEANLTNLPAFAEKMKALKNSRVDSRPAPDSKSSARSTTGGSSSREPVVKQPQSVPVTEACPVPSKKQKKVDTVKQEAQSTPTPTPQAQSEKADPLISQPPSEAVKSSSESKARPKAVVPTTVSETPPVPADKSVIHTPADQEEAVEVEDLLDYKPRFKKDYFLVRWKGDWEDSWEPRHNLLIVGDLMNKMIDLKMSYLHIYGPSEMEQESFVTVQSIRISGSATLSAVVVEMTRDAETRTLLPLQEVRRRWPQQLLDFLLSRLRLRASGDSMGDRTSMCANTHMFPLK